MSSELMNDPVVLVTGETYDSRIIESLFNSGKQTCPLTQKIISDLFLTLNNLLRRMISDWCADHGITNAVVDDDEVVTHEDRDRLTRLLNMISNGAPAEAIKELQQLTRMHTSHRAMLGENRAAILKMISVREATVTTILNLSIHDSNKKIVAEITGSVPSLSPTAPAAPPASFADSFRQSSPPLPREEERAAVNRPNKMGMTRGVVAGCRLKTQWEQAKQKNHPRLYLSEQTDESVANTLVVANREIVKPRVAAAEHISQFNEEVRSPNVKKPKTIIHPGEVNRVEVLPQNSKIVATHTDNQTNLFGMLIWRG